MILGAFAEGMGDDGWGFSARGTSKSIYLPWVVAVLLPGSGMEMEWMACNGAGIDFVRFQSLTFEVKSFKLRTQTGIFGRFSRFLYVKDLLKKTTAITGRRCE